MRRLLPLFLVVLSTVVNLNGQVIASYEFTSGPYFAVTSNDANLTATDVTISSGTISTNITFGSYFPNEPYIQGNSGWTAATQAGAKEFCFTLTPAGGYQLTVSNFSFNGYATSAGPSAIGFTVNGTSFATTNVSSSLVNVSAPVTGVTDVTSTVTICMQGWDNGSRTTNGAGDFRLDDFTVLGEVTAATAPVELSSFTTKKSKNNVDLSWVTASEINNDYFSVEWSYDGKNFQEIAQVAGRGTTTDLQEYSYTHESPATNMNYYRLKQVDYDGKYEYSDIRSMMLANNTVSKVSIFPTVTSGLFNIVSTHSEAIDLKVFDMSGRLVHNASITSNQIVDISALKAGMYIVQMNTETTTYTDRVIKE